jgi:hypothetical protein
MYEKDVSLRRWLPTVNIRASAFPTLRTIPRRHLHRDIKTFSADKKLYIIDFKTFYIILLRRTCFWCNASLKFTP